MLVHQPKQLNTFVLRKLDQKLFGFFSGKWKSTFTREFDDTDVSERQGRICFPLHWYSHFFRELGSTTLYSCMALNLRLFSCLVARLVMMMIMCQRWEGPTVTTTVWLFSNVTLYTFSNVSSQLYLCIFSQIYLQIAWQGIYTPTGYICQWWEGSTVITAPDSLNPLYLRLSR